MRARAFARVWFDKLTMTTHIVAILQSRVSDSNGYRSPQLWGWLMPVQYEWIARAAGNAIIVIS